VNRLRRSSINMAASLVGYVVPMLINLVATPLLLRRLGAAAFGLQSLVAVIIGYMAIMDMGLDLPIIKYLAEDSARGDTETLQIYSGIGLIGMTVIVVAARWLAKDLFKVPSDLMPAAVLVFRLSGVGFLGGVILSWGRAVAMGLQRFDITYGVAVVTNTLGVGLGLVMVYTGYGVVGYVLMRVVTSLVAGLAYFACAKRLVPALCVRVGIDRATLLRVRGYIGYGAINRVMGSVVGRLDQALIGIWLGVAAAGTYAVPFMIVSSLGYMIAYMLGFIFPMASELHSLRELERLHDLFIRSSRFVAAFSAMVFVPLLVFGDRFLAIWVGPEMAGKTASVLRILVVSSYVATVLVTLANSIMVGIGRLREFTIYSLVRGAVIAALCVALIRPFGLNGAAIALLLSNGVDLIYLVVVLRHHLEVSPFALWRKAYRAPIALAVSLGLLSTLLRPLAASWAGLALVIVIFEFLYAAIGYSMGIFGETERRALAGFWRIATQLLTQAERPSNGV
jgi:O-antigen/teichoic acid export membrane protein